ncbi:hypothetical protein [Streptomyces sp. NPDC047042]|uniref:hypothetical protein n=1 Tax=Streptomyces sp. NPDC047042 TaxID=3154807 RepID=UPI00340FD7DB
MAGRDHPLFQIEDIDISPRSGDSVLVIDFDSPTIKERLSSTVAGNAVGYALSRVDPVGDGIGAGYRSLEAIARGYADSWLRQRETDRLIVVAYCSAAALALRFADLLADSLEVGCLLVDPTWPSGELLAAEYSAIRRQLGVRVLADPCPELEPTARLEQMDTVLSAELTAHLVDQGLDDSDARSLAAELAGRYLAWLGFLLATSQALSGPAEQSTQGAPVIPAMDFPVAEFTPAQDQFSGAEVMTKISLLSAALRASADA